jgi:hypothetical protein
MPISSGDSSVESIMTSSAVTAVVVARAIAATTKNQEAATPESGSPAC